MTVFAIFSSFTTSLSGYSSQFWFIAIIVTLLIGIGKTGFGGSLIAIATPIMSLVISVAEAAALLLPLLIIADIFALQHYRKTFHVQNIKIMLPAAVIGVVLGALFFTSFSDKERILKLSIGLIAVGFVLFEATKALLFKNLNSSKPSFSFGSIAGGIAGFTSTLAHVGGPPVSVYLLPQGLDRRIFVGTNAIFFFVVNLLKLVAYFILGLITIGNMQVVLLLIPLLYIGTRLGVLLLKKVNQVWFNRLIYTLLFLTGFQLILGRSLISFFV